MTQPHTRPQPVTTPDPAGNLDQKLDQKPDQNPAQDLDRNLARSRWTVPIRVLAALVAGVVVLAAAATASAFFLTRTVTEHSTIAGPVRRVEITNDTGDVRIRATDRTGAALTASGSSAFETAEHHEQLVDGVLQITGSCSGSEAFASTCAMDLSVQVAPGTVVDVHSGTGDVTVIGISGPMTVDTGTGDIRVDGVGGGGTVRANTGIGDVTGTRLASGIVDVRSDTGDLQLFFVTRPDQLQARTGIGDIRVMVPDDGTSYRVRAETGIGDRQVGVPTSPDSERVAFLKSGTGDLRLTLAP